MPTPPDSSLTTAELIRSELNGKNVALGRYDSILWKVRSGYGVILYGGLTLFFGKERMDPASLDIQIVLLICGFSVLAYFVDLTFRIRQLRVVAAKNQLSDLALQFAIGEPVEAALLQGLLHISGESRMDLDRAALVRAALLIFLFYAATPMFAVAIYLRLV